MTIGIIGTGKMGQALARAIASRVEPVLLAAGRGDVREGLVSYPRCQPATLDEVWRRARLVLLALPFPVARDLMSGPAGGLGGGRTLVDVSNPCLNPGDRPPPGHSAGELIAAVAPTWSTAKAFNTVPAALLDTPQMYGRPVSVPVAGCRPAKSDVFDLAWRLGFDPVDAGEIVASFELESLARLLVSVSTAHRLHGRIAIHIGQPEPVAARVGP